MFEDIEVATILRVVPSLVPQFEEHIRRGDKTNITVFPSRNDKQPRSCKLTFGNSEYKGLLLDLPRHLETYKTLDSQQYYKTNDVAQILIIFDSLEELSKYKDNVYFPDGITPPMKDAYKSLQESENSLYSEPAQDVAAVEAIIYNEKTKDFSYDELIEEEPHLSSKEKTKEAYVYSVFYNKYI